MKKVRYLLASVLAISAMTTPANAAEFLFSFKPSTPLFGPQVSGSGVFTTSDTPTTVGGQTAFSILSITGLVNGSAITALAGNGFGADGSYGNYFTTGGGFLDGSGTRFFTASGLDVRFFQQSTNSQFRVNTFGQFGSSNFVSATSSAVVAAVPEPSSWLMMIFGFAIVGFGMRSRSHSKLAVSYG